MTCWHRLGERCRCGHLTAPARFYWENGKEVSQEKAEAAYLEHLKENMPERYEKLKPQNWLEAGAEEARVLRDGKAVLQECVTKKCVTCNTEYDGRGKECGRCRTKRSRASKP